MHINGRIPLHAPIRCPIHSRPNDTRIRRHPRPIRATHTVHAINPILHIRLPTPRRTPSLGPNIARDTHTDTKRAVAAPGAPRPPRALADWQVVPAEGEVGTHDADEGAEQDVEAEVAEVVEA